MTLAHLPPHHRLSLGPERGLACPWPPPDDDDVELMRHGTFGQLVDGVDVIGWYGIAKRLGYRTRTGAVAEQSARSMPGRVKGFPTPVFVVPLDRGCVEIALCDWAAVRAFAIRTGRLAPDGMTPLRLRPRRGRAKNPRARART